MSVHPTSMIRSLAATSTIIGTLAFTGVASADEITVTQVSGNPTCADIDSSFTEVKVDNPRQGRTDFAGGSFEIKGLYLDWSTTDGIDAVIVKGGDGANVYTAGDESTSGNGLHAPATTSGRPAQISHVQFCTDGVDAPARSTSAGSAAPGPCEPGGPTTMPDGSPCAANHEMEATEAPQGGVLGTFVAGGIPAGAQMSAPGSCVKGSYVQLVRGKGIRKVTMFVNGKRIKTFRGSRTRYAVTINPDRYRSGVMRLKARVEFVDKSGKRAKTFRMTVLRCAQAAVQQAPAFAG